MGANSFGSLFKIMTWGESHGVAIGVVIDGCPAGLSLEEEDLNRELAFRQPGRSPYTSPRREPDKAQIFSGVFEGKTTGAPISIIIFNCDHKGDSYEPIKEMLRPGHANFTYLEKYGIFDYRGGGRSSGRETACRVAAGAVAKKLLSLWGISVLAYIVEVDGVRMSIQTEVSDDLVERTLQSPVFCPDEAVATQLMQRIETAVQEGDSVGGVVEVITSSLPVGLGDPVYEKLETKLGAAMLSIPASKGFEIGAGFAAARMRGSTHNDLFYKTEQERVSLRTNHSGGTLGGISTGMPLHFRVAFKPTSSVKKIQETLTIENSSPAVFSLGEGARHDPCVAIRAVPVVKSMTELVLVDAILMNKCCKI